MQSNLLTKLTETLKSNTPQDFFRLIREELQSPEDIINEHNHNFYHELADSTLHEKHLLTFTENLTQIILTRFTTENLISLINMQSLSNENFSPLHLSILRGKRGLTRRLLEIGADPKLLTSKGRNALHICAESGLIGMFLHIKSYYKIDICVEDFRGMTPLHLAISERREDIAITIISLMSEGIVLDIENKSLKNPLELAVDIGSYKLCKQIMINLKPLKNRRKVLQEIRRKCEDKEISRILKKSSFKGKSYKHFIILFIVLMIKDTEMWYRLFLGGITRGLIETYTQMVLILFCISWMIFVSLKTPGFEVKKRPTGLIELYANYLPEYVCPYCILKKHKQTKHCFLCKKCVKHYDHHCIWLNNCIGKLNYKFFIVFLAILAISSIFSLYICVNTAYHISFENVIKVFKHLETKEIYVYFLVPSFILNLIVLSFIVPIAGKHVKNVVKKVREKPKVPNLEMIKYKKDFSSNEHESTSDTSSMYAKGTLESNSESASSSSSLLSRLFTNN
ncbi:hypothetical protein SteCoe_7181 [Stentor coeruleus]|uniref:Palmitoyltransferase n=1 Tax=Stentor coeruleus TaxID=5963 RepID=A0A1R2CN83_9CILI|nr:hypothetical protein SteCoe_7181 [Stentor coeruleus]